MAIRQYVGARYVPKFYQGSNGNEWDSGVVYEALTMVTYLGSTYCSKKPVPARTVAPNEDTEYWVLTAAYSSQVAELREELEETETQVSTNTSNIQTATTNINTLLASTENLTIQQSFTRKILCIGDSYGMRHDTNWTSLMNSRFNSRSKSYSGRGFLPTGNTFLMTLQAFNTEITDQDEITDIIICGGWNDAREIAGGATPTQLQNAIFECYNYIRTNFPNAIMHLGFIAGQTSYNVQPEVSFTNLEQARYVYNNSFKDQLHHLMSPQYVMQTTWNMDDSYFHPNDTSGALQLCECIAQEITGHSNYEHIFELNNSYLAASNVSNFKCYLQIKDGVQIVKTNNFTISSTSRDVLTFEKQYCPIFPLSVQTSIIGWFNGTINSTPYEGLAYFIFNGSDRTLKVRMNKNWTQITSIEGDASFQLVTSLDLQSKVL